MLSPIIKNGWVITADVFGATVAAACFGFTQIELPAYLLLAMPLVFIVFFASSYSRPPEPEEDDADESDDAWLESGRLTIRI
jgi:hypothetical protein